MQEVQTYNKVDIFNRIVNMFIPFTAIQSDGTFTNVSGGNSIPSEQGLNFIVHEDVADQFEKLKIDFSNGFKLYVKDGYEIEEIKREKVVEPIGTKWTES